MNRGELLSSIDNDIECGSNPQNTDFDGAITDAMIDLRNNGSSLHDKTLLIISLCDVLDSEVDDTCNIISNVDLDGDADFGIILFIGGTTSTVIHHHKLLNYYIIIFYH